MRSTAIIRAQEDTARGPALMAMVPKTLSAHLALAGMASRGHGFWTTRLQPGRETSVNDRLRTAMIAGLHALPNVRQPGNRMILVGRFLGLKNRPRPPGEEARTPGAFQARTSRLACGTGQPGPR
jgi:hypothetical protein